MTYIFIMFWLRRKLPVSPAADGVVVVVGVPVTRYVDEDPVPGAQVPRHGVLTAPRAFPPDPL